MITHERLKTSGESKKIFGAENVGLHAMRRFWEKKMLWPCNKGFSGLLRIWPCGNEWSLALRKLSVWGSSVESSEGTKLKHKLGKLGWCMRKITVTKCIGRFWGSCACEMYGKKRLTYWVTTGNKGLKLRVDNGLSPWNWSVELTNKGLWNCENKIIISG